MEQFDVREKKADILKIVEEYKPEITKNNANGSEIKLTNSFGKFLWIDVGLEIDDAITIFFDGWHAHYYNNKYDYNEFADDLCKILHNERFVVCMLAEYRGGAFLSDESIPNEELLRNEYGNDIKFVCSYWDSSMDVTFEPCNR